MAEQLRVDISLVERQRCAIELCVRLGKSGSEKLQLIHQAYGDDAMRRAAVFKWWKRFRYGETNVKTSRSINLLKLAENGLQHVFEKRMERCKKYIA
jgi:hypothetical protein